MKYQLQARISYIFRNSALSILSFFLSLPVFAGPKILVFSAPYGAGHDKAAQTVQNYIRDQAPDAEVIFKNGQEFMPGYVVDLTQKAFDIGQTKFPKIYTLGFEDYMRKGRKVDHVGQMPMVNSVKLGEFYSWIAKEKPDAILSTWPHAVEWLVALRNKGLLNDVPIGWVHTDSVSDEKAEMGYFEKAARDVDMAFVPSDAIRKEFIAAGVPEDHVTVTGIPVTLKSRPALTLEDRAKIKAAARKELGLNAANKTVMIEAGKNGLGNYPAMIGSILKTYPNEPVTLIAATGANEKQLSEVSWLVEGSKGDAKKESILYSRLKPLLKEGVSKEEIQSWIKNGLPKDRADVRILGFVPLQTWRSAADVVATKPGGLSTAEMASDGIPMILRSELASGQELYNVRKFVEAGLAVEGPKEASVGTQVKEVIGNTEFLNRLYTASENFRKKSRPQDIASWMVDKAQKHLADPNRAKFDEALVNRKRCILSVQDALAALWDTVTPAKAGK